MTSLSHYIKRSHLLIGIAVFSIFFPSLALCVETLDMSTYLGGPTESFFGTYSGNINIGIYGNSDFASDGVNVWTVSQYISADKPSVAKYSPSGALNVYSVPQTSGIVFDSAGNAWTPANYFYSSPNGYGPYSISIAKITPTGSISVYQMLSGISSYTRGIVYDGVNMWMAVQVMDTIGTAQLILVKVTPQGGMTRYNVGPVLDTSGGGVMPWPRIAYGGGFVWMISTDSSFANSAFVAKISTAGVVTKYTGITSPRDVAVDSEGNAWITSADPIKKVTPTGAITSYEPSLYPTKVSFDGVHIWATIGSSTAKIVPSTGVVTRYAVPGATNFVRDLDGNTWTTGMGVNRVNKISPTGVITSYAGGGSENPREILFDGKFLWTNNVSSVTKIDTHELAPPVVSNPTATPAVFEAVLGADVTSLGYPATISERGTCWGLTANPATNCASAAGAAAGVFSHTRTGLSPNTTYHYRGYATNSTGTGYSSDATFTTTGSPDLTVGPVSSLTGIVNEVMVLSASVTNAGVLPTTQSISNTFQFATAGDGTGATSPVVGTAIGGLAINESKTTSYSWTPTIVGTYYVRACTDTANVVAESSGESNNCGPSPWAKITIIPKPYNCPVCSARQAYDTVTNACVAIKCPAGKTWSGSSCN